MPLDQPPTLAPVEVRAARLPQAASDGAYSIATVSTEQLRRRDRLDEVLSALPGVSLFRRSSSLSANPTTQGLTLRGIGPTGAGRTLVTLDGVPQSDPFGGWVIWSALPTQGLSTARIVRGAGAGPYGAGALTGVIDLVSAAGVPGDASLDISAGSFGLRNAAGAFVLGAPNLSAQVTASATKRGGWIAVGNGRGDADTPITLETWSVSGRLAADLGPRVLALRAAAFGEGRDSGLRGAASDVSGGQVSATLVQVSQDHGPGWRLQGWATWSDLANTSVAVAPGRATTTPANDQFRTPARGFGVNMALRQSVGGVNIELGADLRTAEGQTHELFRFQNGAFTRLRVAGGRTFDVGLYLESDWRAGPWLLTGGARLDQWRSDNAVRRESDLASGLVTLDQAPLDHRGLETTLRLGIRRDLGTLNLRAAAYSGFRPPTLNELHRPFRVGNDITEANVALTPERLVGIETGFDGTPQRGKDQFALSIRKGVD